ncbi:hypothetical protein J4573_26225 [Actinomadura barringtoniae]|uniref:Integral membrane bound transporter domain-containing protein n=2 Tax=Actinomadura barringtoniae TaxID=1427535 RepID=A0A939PD35_9ACTN|nr:hypothetical protein [Actinomadura barringtoniae]
MVAYLLALAVLPDDGPVPLLAPLTALLVVQFSVYETIKSSVSRITAVGSGVLVAVALAGEVGFSWWSLGIAILVALVIGHLLRLGDHVLEVPISAMLIFALGAGNGIGTERIVETLIGAAAGLLATMLVPSVRVRPAQEAVEDLSDRLAALLDRMAADLSQGPSKGEAEGWLRTTEELFRDIGRTDAELGAAENSVRLNPRARGLLDAGIALRNGVETMEHFTLSLRGLTRALADIARLEDDDRLIGDTAVRDRLSATVTEIAASMAAYGRLARSDLRRNARTAAMEDTLERHVMAARAHRDALASLLHDPEAGEERWALYGEIVMHLDRLIDQVRLEHRTRAREAWRRRSGVARHLPERPASIVSRTGTRLRWAASITSAAVEGHAKAVESRALRSR